MDLSICIFCIYFVFSICVLFAFYFAFMLLFALKKKTKQKRTKANRKSRINANKMQMDKSTFFPCVSCFCTIYFACVFFRFEVLLFDFPCVFLFFHFFEFKNH